MYWSGIILPFSTLCVTTQLVAETLPLPDALLSFLRQAASITSPETIIAAIDFICI
jgi:hypothetical protein